ncbi:MAG: tRNA (adenosine(37)-N6)-threonylcarbamoyltransferase complex ATPase subunit type 1 TsaE [Silvanigrellaceae bacterium]
MSDFLKEEIQRSLLSGVEFTFDCALADIEPLVLAISQSLMPGDWLLLSGDLGAGKTTLTQKIASSLGFVQKVSSPTYAIVNVIENEQGASGIRKLCHLDLYRIKRADELLHLGLEVELNSKAICIIEWAENVETSGWSYFFDQTGCKKPRRVLDVSIFHENNDQQRRYSLCWKKPESLFEES